MRRNMRKMSLKQLQEMVQHGGPDQFTAVVKLLQTDPRSGVQRLVRQCEQRLQEWKAQLERTGRMLGYERQVWAMGYQQVAGIAEVGRGPLAGPVVAAAVILPPTVVLPALEGSKRMTPKRRDELYQAIRTQATAIGVGMVQPDGVDESSVTVATYQAMAKAVANLSVVPDYLLVGGLHVPYVALPQAAVIGGEAQSAAIAAACIVAKVARDEYMVEMDRRYPAYGFAHHKGYGTIEHRDALTRLGPSPLHRRPAAGGRQLLAFDRAAFAADE